jgi:hypothetical protein
MLPSEFQFYRLLVIAMVAMTATVEAKIPQPIGFLAYNQTFFDRVLLSWNPPNTTKTLTGFKLEYYPENEEQEMKTVFLNSTEVNHIVKELEGHTKYTFKLYSRKGEQESKAVAISLQTIDAGVPKPMITELNPLDNAAVEVKWHMDSFHGKINSFNVEFQVEQAKEEEVGDQQGGQVRRVDDDVRQMTVLGLREKTKYFVRVWVVTSKGERSSDTKDVITTSAEGDDDKSLAIIMSCAIIVPVLLIVLFVLLYMYVLRPAFGSSRYLNISQGQI